MRHLIILFLFIFSTASFAKQNGPSSWWKSPSPGFLHILPYEYFLNLTTGQKSAYLQNIRDYLSEQEKKWQGKQIAGVNSPWNDFAQFLEPDQAWAADAPQPNSSTVFNSSDCASLNKLPSAVSDFVKEGKNKCLIGGFLVCLTYSDNHLKCNVSDPAFQAFASSECSGIKDYVPCAEPFYLDENGGSICVASKDAKGNFRPISPQCEKASDIGKLVKNLENNPAKYSKQYEVYRKQFEAYCGKEGKNAHFFDATDCRVLQTRLDKIKSLYKSVDDGLVCHNRVSIDGETVEVKLRVNEDGAFKTEVVGETHGWIVAKCDEAGDTTNPLTVDEKFHKAEWQSCLVRQDKATKAAAIETLSFAGVSDPCEMTSSVKSQGHISAQGNCSAELRDKHLWTSGNHAYSADLNGAHETELNHYEYHYGTSEQPGMPELIFNPADKICLAVSYQVRAKTQDLSNVTDPQTSDSSKTGTATK